MRNFAEKIRKKTESLQILGHYWPGDEPVPVLELQLGWDLNQVQFLTLILVERWTRFKFFVLYWLRSWFQPGWTRFEPGLNLVQPGWKTQISNQVEEMSVFLVEVLTRFMIFTNSNFSTRFNLIQPGSSPTWFIPWSWSYISELKKSFFII